jgi:hypothetical protein
MQFEGRSEVVLRLCSFLVSLSRKSRKDELRGEFQTAKTSGYADQISLKSESLVIQPVELLLLLSPARTGDQTEVFYVTKIEIYVSGYHETGCGFFGLGVKKR